MPVTPRPPAPLSLNALRACEAAARLGGFAAAAAELGVTPGAVAAQIKGLEAQLGAPLFRRHSRGVALTELGARALPTLSRAFDALSEASDLLRAEAAPRRLSIVALPALAQLWLRPRLPALEAAFPGLRISITAAEAPPAGKRHGHDLSLFYAAGGRDWLVPVRCPGAPPGPRLSDADWSEDWRRWRAGAGTASAGEGGGTTHSLYALAIEEALAGRGTAMGRGALVGPLLDEGRLEEAGPRVPLPVGPVATPLRGGALAQQVAAWITARI